MPPLCCGRAERTGGVEAGLRHVDDLPGLVLHIGEADGAGARPRPAGRRRGRFFPSPVPASLGSPATGRRKRWSRAGGRSDRGRPTSRPPRPTDTRPWRRARRGTSGPRTPAPGRERVPPRGRPSSLGVGLLRRMSVGEGRKRLAALAERAKPRERSGIDQAGLAPADRLDQKRDSGPAPCSKSRPRASAPRWRYGPVAVEATEYPREGCWGGVEVKAVETGWRPTRPPDSISAGSRSASLRPAIFFR